MIIPEYKLRMYIRQSLLEAVGRAGRRQVSTGMRLGGGGGGEEDLEGSKSFDSLSPKAKEVFLKFKSALEKAGHELHITSTRRMPSHQWDLKYGSKKGITPAKPCRSDHQYGYAADINVTLNKDTKNKKSVTSKSLSKDWKPIVDIAASVGLKWQGEKDKVHFYLQTNLESRKTQCDQYFTSKFNTKDKSKWDYEKMKELEDNADAELSKILDIPRKGIKVDMTDAAWGKSGRKETGATGVKPTMI